MPVADPEILKRGARSRKGGGPPPEIAKKSRILGLKSWVLLTFDGKFRAKRGRASCPPLNPPLSAQPFITYFVYIHTLRVIKYVYSDYKWQNAFQDDNTVTAISVDIHIKLFLKIVCVNINHCFYACKYLFKKHISKRIHILSALSHYLSLIN